MGKVTGTGFPQRKVLYSQMTRGLITLVFFEFLIHGLLDALLECGVGEGGAGFPWWLREYNTGDTVLFPGPRRSHMPRSS